MKLILAAIVALAFSVGAMAQEGSAPVSAPPSDSAAPAPSDSAKPADSAKPKKAKKAKKKHHQKKQASDSAS